MGGMWNSIKRFFIKLQRDFGKITGKKHHLEFFTALLSLPVLITVLILNISNLNNNKKPAATPTPQKQEIVITIPQQQNTTTSTNQGNVPTKKACEPIVGDVSIASPDEGDTVTDNPVAVDIDTDTSGPCAVVWSYRINGGAWSSFDDKSIALFNPPSGDITLDLRIKSIVAGGGEKQLTRHFTYKGTSTVTPTATPTIATTPSTAVTP